MRTLPRAQNRSDKKKSYVVFVSYFLSVKCSPTWPVRIKF